MKGTVLAPLLAAAVMAIAGCVSGPRFGDVQQTIPPLSAEQGRIFFYRAAGTAGAAVQPEIRLNDNVVGRSQPGSFFFVDCYPGPMHVSMSTEVDKAIDFSVAAGQTRYVETSVSMGLFVGHVSPKLIDPEQARNDLLDLAYTGLQPLLAQPAPGPASDRASSSTAVQNEAGPVPVKLEDIDQLRKK